MQQTEDVENEEWQLWLRDRYLKQEAWLLTVITQE